MTARCFVCVLTGRHDGEKELFFIHVPEEEEEEALQKKEGRPGGELTASSLSVPLHPSRPP